MCMYHTYMSLQWPQRGTRIGDTNEHTFIQRNWSFLWIMVRPGLEQGKDNMNWSILWLQKIKNCSKTKWRLGQGGGCTTP